MRRQCSNCLFSETCGSGSICEHYAPLVDDIYDKELDNIIEKGRSEYYDEWRIYLSDFNDDLFF